jgi:hypothetical protein
VSAQRELADTGTGLTGYGRQYAWALAVLERPWTVPASLRARAVELVVKEAIAHYGYTTNQVVGGYVGAGAGPLPQATAGMRRRQQQRLRHAKLRNAAPRQRGERTRRAPTVKRRAAASATRRGPPSEASKQPGDDDPPPPSELGRTAQASLRLAARIARRNGRRFRHRRVVLA